MRLKLDLDNETMNRLIEEAVAERRPLRWEAEVLLRRALGLPDRCDGSKEVEPCPS